MHPRLIRAIVLLTFTAAPAHAAAPFGRFFTASDLFAEAPRNPVYTVAPLTVECLARVTDRSKRAVLIAHERPHSATHWQLYADKDTGHFAARINPHKPEAIESAVNVADGQWHHLALTFDGQTATLFVDAKQVASEKLDRFFMYPDTGPLTLAYVGGEPINEHVSLDEIRISRTVRKIDRTPDEPFKPDAETIALWHFDNETKTGYPDASATKNPVRLRTAPTGLSKDNITKTRWTEMDLAPFFSSSLGAPTPRGNVTHKAISIPLNKEKTAAAAVAFDTESFRLSAFWTGGFLKIHPNREGLAQHPDVAGNVHFATQPGPGWSTSESFTDPRPNKLGPLPREHGRYNGLYLHDDRVILSYTVAGTDVLETHDLESEGELLALARTIRLGPTTRPLTLKLYDASSGAPSAGIIGASNPEAFDYRIVHGPRDLRADGGMITVPSSISPTVVKVLLFHGHAHNIGGAIRHLSDKSPPPLDLPALITGGPARWPNVITTKGTLGTETGAYQVDTLTAPDANPWNSFLRFGGHDFFPDGTASICSVSGDVWLVSGIDAELQNLKWKRFAAGLFQPLGLKIAPYQCKLCPKAATSVADAAPHIYVLGRDQITRLHDLNADGEADFYENFNNDCKVTANGHAYATNLDTDPDGNFYYTKCADNTEHGGTLLRVSADGSTLDVFTTGLRNPNGMGVSPTGDVTEADNQGEWVPASRLDLVRRGAFLGYQPMSKRTPPPTDPGKPLCWMPQNADNSSGGQTWVLDHRWGLPKDTMLHTSYGAAALLHVMHETVDGQIQGGVYRWPLTFATGIMRGRFNPADGQLYVSGLKGWQTRGSRDGAFQRVRYTGRPLHLPVSLNVHKNGLRLTFTGPLDPKTAADPDSWSVLRWNYQWTSAYGSRQWSVTNPDRQGFDTLEIKSARLLPDKKSVFLEIADLRPVMQMQITYNIESATGDEIEGDIFNTIHSLRPDHRLP